MTNKPHPNRAHPMHTPHRAFSAPEELAKKFDAPERETWQKPEQVIDCFAIQSNATVAELGSGTGYFAIRLAKRLGMGKVIGLDDEPNMVGYLQARCESLGLSNVEARPAKREGKINLAEKIDLLFSVDTYHHIRERTAFFADVLPFLKVGSRLIVIDRKVEPGQMRVAPETVIQEMRDAGFLLVERFDFLPKQYFLVFAPNTDRDYS